MLQRYRVELKPSKLCTLYNAKPASAAQERRKDWMKVILYMAISANGLIAKSDDDTSWITKEEWESYSAAVRKAGNLIVGHRTYDILTKQPEFSDLGNAQLVVVSKDHDLKTVSKEHLVADSPRKALALLDGFREVVVAGGGILNGAFLAENLVDEIYLDVEPIVIGEGVSVFRDRKFEKKLKFLGQRNISDNEIQLHYRVVK